MGVVICRKGGLGQRGVRCLVLPKLRRLAYPFVCMNIEVANGMDVRHQLAVAQYGNENSVDEF